MPISKTNLREIRGWVVLNALWVPLTVQDTALMAIAVPASTIRLAPQNHVAVLAWLASIVALATALVPLFAGWLSDALRRRGGSRRAFAGAGVAIDVAALAAIPYTHTLVWFAILLVIATLGANVALSAYQVMLPESVPRRQWGVASGVRGVATLVGSILGFAIAGSMPDPAITFTVTAAIMTLGGLSLLAIGEGTYDGEEHARVRDWHDFGVVFAARVLVFFGLTMLQTFVLFFIRDVQHIQNASAGTALYAFATIVGALTSSIYLGILSDRAPRKLIAAAAIAAMALATIGFALAPVLAWMLPFAVLFGIGFGGVMSTGWALAMDTIPKMRDVGRDLGLWGIGSSIPNIIAPLFGGWLIGLFGGTRAGYQAVFAFAGFSFALASLSVLRVGRRPLSSLWGWPLRFAAVTSNYIWDHTAYRMRTWGRLPRRRGATLIVANHQHDFESPAIVSTMTVHSGSWRHPIFTASSRRMYEPGFLADRLPWVSFAFRGVNAGKMLMALGMLPLENELASRALAAFAFAVQRRHGPLPLSEVFDERVAGKFPPGTRTSDLWRREFFLEARTVVKVSTMREPYRREIMEETRAGVEGDLAFMEDIVRRGATFYLTPEGHYTIDGRMRPMRGVIDRLSPLATIYLVGVSYDPFVSRRLSMLCRVEPLEGAPMIGKLAAIRPVVTSQLLGEWLHEREGWFTQDEAAAAIRERLAGLPSQLFVEPELRRDPHRMIRSALPLMVQWGILERDGERYRTSAQRLHPQFPFVKDILAYQTAFLHETLENAGYGEPLAG
ncbi:MAG TPA: MFS transporter [Candidatus Cybelea sp.]|nr:MFS transporter [Candidatus Cybelea sp.]